jgi:hypothetical protein
VVERGHGTGRRAGARQQQAGGACLAHSGSHARTRGESPRGMVSDSTNTFRWFTTRLWFGFCPIFFASSMLSLALPYRTHVGHSRRHAVGWPINNHNNRGRHEQGRRSVTLTARKATPCTDQATAPGTASRSSCQCTNTVHSGHRIIAILNITQRWAAAGRGASAQHVRRRRRRLAARPDARCRASRPTGHMAHMKAAYKRASQDA